MPDSRTGCLIKELRAERGRGCLGQHYRVVVSRTIFVKAKPALPRGLP